MNRKTVIKGGLLLLAFVGIYLTVVGMAILYLDYPMDLSKMMNRDGLLFVMMGVTGIMFADLHISKILMKEDIERLQNIDNELYGGHLSMYHRICNIEKKLDSHTETGQKPN